jgi:hypothetical protein
MGTWAGGKNCRFVTDLLGDWTVDVIYGRIGTRGRTVRHVADDEAGARKLVRHCLQRRSTAPRRIGIDYKFGELSVTGQWISAASHGGR